MQTEQLRHSLESLDAARVLLHDWGLRDLERGWHNWTALARDVGLDRLPDLARPLGRLLARCPDPGMALTNFGRFVATPAGAQQLPVLLDARARTLETLLQLLSTSQFFSDLLVANPDFLDMLQVPLRDSPSGEEMRQ